MLVHRLRKIKELYFKKLLITITIIIAKDREPKRQTPNRKIIVAVKTNRQREVRSNRIISIN